MNCGECHTVTTRSKPTVFCESCKKQYHSSCISTSIDILAALNNVPGLTWRCNECRKSCIIINEDEINKHLANKLNETLSKINDVFVHLNMVDKESTASDNLKKNCNYCRKKVINGLCCSKCEVLYHSRCAQRVKSCCNELLKEEIKSDCNGAMTEEKYLKEENLLLRQIIQDKDCIINDKNSLITLLNDKVSHLEQPCHQSSNGSKNKLTNNNKEKQVQKVSLNFADDTEKTGMKNNQAITKKYNKNKSDCVPIEASPSLHSHVDSTRKQYHSTFQQLEIETRQKCSEIMNLVDNANFQLDSDKITETSQEDPHSIKNTTSEKEPWKTVASRKNKNKQLRIVGSNSSSNMLADIKGVPKFVDLHVYRLQPTTTKDDLESFLRPHFPEVSCSAMTSRHPHLYSSFKVKIFGNHFSKAMEPTLWPENACVSRFLYLKKSSQPHLS